MHALLLIAHGSRREAANDEVREMARRVESIERKRFVCVIPAFLELAEPDIQTGVDLCAQAGAVEITVLPFFLSAGRHVAEDIPRALAQASKRYPHISIYLAQHIGQHQDMPKLLFDASMREVRDICMLS